jgi:hypothetical protein
MANPVPMFFGVTIMAMGEYKGVGPSTTLAWPGCKQSDIAVEVETARFECTLMDTDTVKELPGYPEKNSPSGSFLS